LNLSGNRLCGLWFEYDNYGDEIVRGTYNAEGITAVADALRVHGALTMLSLARNKLGEEGTKAICEALEQNKTLKELDISGDINRSNVGGSAGAKHVAKMLRVNGVLTEIQFVCRKFELSCLHDIRPRFAVATDHTDLCVQS
jgi:hypothetical protein